MKYTVKAFGITKDILGGSQMTVQSSGTTVSALRQALLQQYPALAGLRSVMIAVNNVYADDQISLTENDEIALIPPVSGG